LVLIVLAAAGCRPALAQSEGGAAGPTDRTNPLVQQPAVLIDGADKAPMLAIARAGHRLVAVGEHGIVLLSDDDGAHFRQAKAVPTRTTLNAVTFVSNSEGWIAGHWGVILHTVDGGETWSSQREDMTVDQPLFSILFTDARNGFTAGLWSLMLATHDGGHTWAPIALPAPKGSPKADKNLYQILSDGKGLMLIAAEQGYVYRSTDSGRSWTVVESGNPGSFWTGLILDDGAILMGGLSGGLSRSGDHGQSWSRVETKTKSSITGLAQASDGRVVAVGLDGISLDSTDRGKTFTLHVRDDQRPLNAVAINAKGLPVIASSAGVAAGS
jgi:photosystem II stability/assembly factor-like uncharacterized protein